MADAINIILFEKEHPNVEFVEIETDDGKSIAIGKRIAYGNYVKIRITPDDIKDVCRHVVEDGQEKSEPKTAYCPQCGKALSRCKCWVGVSVVRYIVKAIGGLVRA